MSTATHFSTRGRNVRISYLIYSTGHTNLFLRCRSAHHSEKHFGYLKKSPLSISSSGKTDLQAWPDLIQFQSHFILFQSHFSLHNLVSALLQAVDPAASQVDGMWGHESATNRFVEIETANLWLEDPQGFHAILKVLLGNLHFFRAISLRQPCLDFANASAICPDPRCD